MSEVRQLPLTPDRSRYDSSDHEYKTCRDCGNTKPLGDFYPVKSKAKVQSICKDCRKNHTRQYKANNPDRVKEYWRKANWRKYGIVGFSEADYVALLDRQSGLCALCGESGQLYADHDHENGTIRGLLCNRCNLNLGIYEKLAKDPKVAAYLSFHAEGSADG